MDLHKGGQKSEVVIAQEEQEVFTVACATRIQTKKVIIDGERDITQKAIDAWGVQICYLQGPAVGCYSMNANGLVEYPGRRVGYHTGSRVSDILPIPLPEATIDVGHKWSGRVSEDSFPAHHQATGVLKAFENRMGYRCAHLCFEVDPTCEPPQTVYVFPDSIDIFVSDTRNVWLAVEEGIIVEAQLMREVRPLLINQKTGDLVRDPKKGVQVDRSKVVSHKWDVRLVERTRLNKSEFREAHRGLFLLRTAQEITTFPKGLAVARRRLQCFCSNFPRSPWYKTASEQKEYLTRKLKK